MSGIRPFWNEILKVWDSTLGEPVELKSTNGSVKVSGISAIPGTPASHSTLEMNGGDHQFATVTAGKDYRVDSDIDVHVASSTGTGADGIPMTAASGDYLALSGDHTNNLGTVFPGNEFDFGTNDISVEIWCTLDRQATSSGGLVSIGDVAETHFVVSVLAENVTDGVGDLKVQLDMEEDTNTRSMSEASTLISGTHDVTDLIHVVLTIDRSAETYTPYINGTAYTPVDYSADSLLTSDTLNMSTVATGDVRISGGIGGTPGGTFDGTFYAARIYTGTLLTSAEVQRRTDRGPLSVPVDGTVPTAIINASNLNGSNQLQITDANGTNLMDFSVTNGVTLPDDISSTNVLANTTDYPRIIANKPENVAIPSGATSLSVYAPATASGKVRITEL